MNGCNIKVSKKETARILTRILDVTSGELQRAVIKKLLGDFSVLSKIEFVYDGSYLPNIIFLRNTDGLIDYDKNSSCISNKKTYGWSFDSYKNLINMINHKYKTIYIHFASTSDSEYNDVINSIYRTLFFSYMS